MINSVTLMGRLASDPEFKVTPSGVEVTTFRLAVGDGDDVSFINCVAWRRTAIFVHQYFTKGKMLALEGYIQSRQYTDKNGNNRTAFEVVLRTASFCGDKPKEEKQETYEDATYFEVTADDLPF